MMQDEMAEKACALVREALDGIAQSLLIIDGDLDIVMVNAGFVRLFELPADIVKPGAPVIALHRYLAQRGEYGAGDCEQQVADRQSPIINRVHYRLERKRACGMYLEITGNPLPSGGYVFTFTDISERRQAQDYLEQEVCNRTQSLSLANQRLSELADLDPLLGIANRRKFYEMAGAAREQQLQQGGELSVLMIDVDHFKQINDRYGHALGDEVLKQIAATLSQSVRRQDSVARFGGEEFVVLLEGSNIASAEKVAGNLRRKVAALGIATPSGRIRVTISIGVAPWPSQLFDIDELLRRADTALYQAKHDGRNCVRVHGV